MNEVSLLNADKGIYEIVEIENCNYNSRLLTLGFIPGEKIEIIKPLSWFSLPLIYFRNSRYALSEDVLEKIVIKKLE
jgi:Fe2+ transport system protein FeoA